MFLIKVESSLQLPDTHNTVAVRASLAQEYVKVNIHLMNKTRPIFFLNVNGNTIVKLVYLHLHLKLVRLRSSFMSSRYVLPAVNLITSDFELILNICLLGIP